MVGKGNYVGGRPKDESKLSRDPAQIRRRLRRARKNKAKTGYDTNLYIDSVYNKPMEQWDDEELSRGRPRNKAGDFRGGAPKWITPAIQQEARRRLLDQTIGKMHGQISAAIQCLADLITSTEVDDRGKPIVDARTRLAACIFIIEQVTGKPKAIVEIEGSNAVRQAIAAAIVLDDGKPQGYTPNSGVVEGVIVEDDE